MASWVPRWGLVLLVAVLVLASLASAEEVPEEEAKAAEPAAEAKPEGEAAEAGAEGEKKEGEKEAEKEKEETVPLQPGEVMTTTNLRSVLGKYTMFVVAVVNKDKQEGYKKFRGEFQSAAKVLKGLVQLVEVDGTSEEAKEAVEYMVPKKKGERAWPGIHFFSSKPMWQTNKDSQPVSYKGNSTAVAITKWVHGKMTGRHVRRLRTKSEFDNEKLQNLQDKQPLVILFHNDTIASPEYRALSINMWERASFFDARVNHNKTKRWMKSLRLSIVDDHLPVLIVAKPTGTITGDGNMGDIVIHGGKRLPKPKEEEEKKEEKKEDKEEGEDKKEAEAEKKEGEEKKEEAKEETKEEEPKKEEDKAEEKEEEATEKEADEDAEPAKFDYHNLEDVVDDHALTVEQREELLDRQEKEWEEEEAKKKAEEEKRKQRKLEKEKKEKEERRRVRSEYVAPYIEEAVKQQELDGEFIVIREELPEAGLPLADSEILREEWLI